MKNYISIVTNDIEWSFSKIDESLDDVFIPYNDPNKGNRKFLPDFVFWLKKKNKYAIVFVDPKGTKHAEYQLKVDGYNKLFEKSKGKQSVKKEEKTYSPYLKEQEVSELSGESDEDRKTTLNVKKYRDMNKSEQEQKLWDLGYTKKYIRSLNTEDKRVNVLLKEIEND